MKINYDLKVGFTAALTSFIAVVLMMSTGCEYYSDKEAVGYRSLYRGTTTPTDPAACPGELVNGVCTITVEPPASNPVVCGEGTVLVDGVCVPGPVAEDPPAEDPEDPEVPMDDSGGSEDESPESPWTGFRGTYRLAPTTTVAYFTPPPDETVENPDQGIEETFGIAGPTVPVSGGLSEEGELVSAGLCSDVRRDGSNVMGVGLHTFIEKRTEFTLNSWVQKRTLTGIYLDCRKTGDWVEASEIVAEPSSDPEPDLRRVSGDTPPENPQETWDRWIRHLEHADDLTASEGDDNVIVGSTAPAGHALVGIKLLKCQNGFITPDNIYCGAAGLFKKITRQGNILDANPIVIESPQYDNYAPDLNSHGDETSHNKIVQCPESDQVVTGLRFRKSSSTSVRQPGSVTWVELSCSRITSH